LQRSRKEDALADQAQAQAKGILLYLDKTRTEELYLWEKGNRDQA